MLFYYSKVYSTYFVHKVCFNLLTRLFYHFRSSLPGVFLGKGGLKICDKFTGKNPCRSVISIKLQSNIKHLFYRNISELLLPPFFNIPQQPMI